jgi:ATP-dependent helicase/nuclease subunit A
MRQGEQRQANLRLFLEYARQYEDIGYGGLSGFIRFIDKAIREGHDFSGANTASENANVVKVMSVHRSKGLEFPICFLSDCSKKFNTRDLNAGSLIHSTLGFSTKVREPQKLKQYSTAPHEALKLQLEKEALSEEMRILYVALTRAKEKLIITLSLKNAEKKVKSISAGLDDKIGIVPYVVRSAGSYADWLLMTAARQSGMQSLRSLYSLNTEVLEEQSGYKTFVIASHDKEESAQEEIKIDFQSKPNDAILSQLRNNLDFEYQDEDLSKIPAKLSVTDITKKKRGEQTQLRERPDFFKKDHLTPSERGTIVHKFMQFADYHNARKDLMSEIERLLVDGFLTESETKALSIQKLETFFHSKLMSRILNADEIWREFRFFDEVNAGEVYDDLDLSGEQPQILIQGIADCVIVEGESVSVIDYKTDAVQNPDQLVERYEQQLLLYKKALGKCFEKPINQCIIYSTHLGKEIIL